jgi:sugar phosphate isomerase/epimerase
MKQIPIALQLYTVRDDANKDLAGTFAELSSFGYTNVELAGLYGKDSGALKPMLSDADLRPISAHVGLPDLSGENAGDVIKSYLDLGVYTLVVPHLGGEYRLDGAGYADTAEKLNKAGETLATYGCKIGYHNHDFEFTEKHEGKSGIEILIENTDPALVTFELDTYWALFANVDPVEFINKYATRLSLLHIKDMDPVDRSFAPVGTGLLPLDAIHSAAVDAKISYLIVEQDSCKGSALESVKLSFENLKKKGYC